MRILVIKKDSDLSAIAAAAAAAPALVERLAAFNPHVDLKKLEAGSVLLVPDEVAGAAGAGTPFGQSGSVAGDALASFGEFAAEALAGAASGVKAGLARQVADADALKAALRSKTVRDALARDADLAKQADAALRNATEAAKAADAGAKQFDGQVAAAREAIATLAKGFG